MAMKLQIYEILSKLKEFTGEGSVAKKIEWLKKNDSATLRMILKHNFDSNIKYNLPDGDPPFARNPNPIDYNETTLYAETRKLSYLWITHSDSALENLTETQKQQLDAVLAIQEEKGQAFNKGVDIVKQTQKEIVDAREALEQARKRLERAIETDTQARKQLAVLKAEADRAMAYAGQVRQQFQNLNAQLMARQQPQVEASPRSNMPKYRLETMFIQMLEALHPNEADVILATKNKTLAKKFPITKDIVKKAFPDIL